ncbi:MAG: choice-of-anchor tandem repeat NxxGxxAF-containing protein [Planctomycetota bacterium]
MNDFRGMVLGAWLAAGVGIPAMSEAGPFAYDQIALTGQQAPGAEDGVVYAELGAATLNRAGDVAFRATLTGPADADPRLAVFGPPSGNGSGLTLLAREGDPVPGAADGSVFGRFQSELNNPVLLDSFGQVAFYSRLRNASGADDPTTGPNAILRSRLDTGLMPAVRPGDEVPGVGGGLIFDSFLGFLTLNDSGLLQYVARVNGPGVLQENDQVVLRHPLNGVGEIVVREDGPVPGSDGTARLGGGAMDSNTFGFPRINATGDIVIETRLRDGGDSSIDFTNDSVILGPTAGPGSELGVLFREGDPVPGVPGAAFNRLFLPSLYANSDLVLLEQMRSLPGVATDETLDEAIFRVMAGNPNSIELLVREGEDAPDIGGDVVLGGELFEFSGTALGDVVSNAAGDLAFRSALSSPSGVGVTTENDTALFRTTDVIGSPLELVYREGDPAPAQIDGAVFGTKMPRSPGDNGLAYIAAMNGVGDFIFVSDLRGSEGGPVLDDTNDRALFASIAGEVLPILREGDSIEVELAGGILESRTIADLFVGFVGANEGGEGDTGFLVFNDGGQLLLEVPFTDGSSGLFVYQVPEPAAGVLLGIAVCWVAGRRRRNG